MLRNSLFFICISLILVSARAEDIDEGSAQKFGVLEKIPAAYFSAIPNISFEYILQGRMGQIGAPGEPTLTIRFRFTYFSGKYSIEELERKSPTLPFEGLEKFTFDGSKYYFLNSQKLLSIGTKPRLLKFRLGIFSLPFFAPYRWIVGTDYCYSLAQLADQAYWEHVLINTEIEPSSSPQVSLLLKTKPALGPPCQVEFNGQLPFPTKVTRNLGDLVSTLTVKSYKSVGDPPFIIPTSTEDSGADVNGQPTDTWWKVDVDTSTIKPSTDSSFEISPTEAKRVYDADIEAFIKK